MAMGISTASAKNLRREQAIHNQEVCLYLFSQNGYGDWVITTAFYSCLHWIEYHIFPLTVYEGDRSLLIPDINEYALWVKWLLGSQGKHQLRRDLVWKHCKHIAGKYESLYDSCMSARYVNYNVGQERVVKAVKNLEAIRAFCESKS